MTFTRKCAALSYHVHSPYCIIFKCIFLNENVWISIKISLKFVPKDPISNCQPVFQIMAWCRLGDKPLSKPMVVNLLTHLCVTRPQWIKNKKGVQQENKSKKKASENRGRRFTVFDYSLDYSGRTMAHVQWLLFCIVSRCQSCWTNVPLSFIKMITTSFVISLLRNKESTNMWFNIT